MHLMSSNLTQLIKSRDTLQTTSAVVWCGDHLRLVFPPSGRVLSNSGTETLSVAEKNEITSWSEKMSNLRLSMYLKLNSGVSGKCMKLEKSKQPKKRVYC